jgi:hypothetical protein
MIKVSYRQAAGPDDLSFVYANWLHSAKKDFIGKLMRSSAYFDFMSSEIDFYVLNAKTILICEEQDENHFYGFISYKKIGDILIINYAYIKPAFQKLGLMTSALKHIDPLFGLSESGITCTNKFIAKRSEKYKLTFNPKLKQYLKGEFT